MPKENHKDTQQGFTGGIYGEAENPSAKPSKLKFTVFTNVCALYSSML